MFKSILITLALLGSVAASAANLEALSNPAMPPITNPHWMHCASIGFAADSSVYGACQVSYSGCSGRYCHSPSRFFTATWNREGTDPVLGVLCASIPAGMGAAKIAYTPGYSGDNCKVSYNPTGTAVYAFGYPFYYVSTDPVTGAELVNSNVQSYLYTP